MIWNQLEKNPKISSKNELEKTPTIYYPIGSNGVGSKFSAITSNAIRKIKLYEH